MNNDNDFIVIDTEGKTILTEISIIDSQGKLIYQAFNHDLQRDRPHPIHEKTLRQIMTDFYNLSKNKIVICHNVEHDRAVLQNSAIKAGMRWQSPFFLCTLELAKKHIPNSLSYSLEYLSKSLQLKENSIYLQ